MNEEQLKELGLEEAQINSVIKLHKDTLDGNYVTKTRFNEVNEEVKNLKEDITDRDTQLEKLKEVDPEKLQETISDLQDDNKKQQEKYEAQLKELRVNHALESQLKEAGAKNVKAVSALLELGEEVELDENGLVKGLDEKLTSLKESDDYLFNVKEEPKDAEFKGTQPGKQKQSEPGGTVDLSKMTYEQLDAYFKNQENN